MRSGIRRVLLVGLAVTGVTHSVTGCWWRGGHTTYDRRFAKEIDDPSKCEDATASFDASAFSFPTATPVTKGVGLTDLDGQAQKALIEVLGKDAESADWRSTLGDSFGVTRKPSQLKRSNRFNRTIVVSIVSLRERLTTSADRISESSLRLSIEADDEATFPKFKNWNRFVTDYGEVDLGKFSSQRKVTGAIKGTLGPPQVPAGVSVEPSVALEETSNRELQLKDRYISLTGVLDEKSARLVQQGTVGIDVGGNISFDVEIEVVPDELTVTSFSNLFSSKTTPVVPDLVEIRTWKLYSTKSAAEPVVISGSLHATVRHVVNGKGRRTLTEGDDHVVFCPINYDLKPFEVIGRDALYHRGEYFRIEEKFKLSEGQRSAAAAALKKSLGADTKIDPQELRVASLVEMKKGPADRCGGLNQIGLFVETEEEASELIRWLRAQQKAQLKAGRDDVKISTRPVCLCPRIGNNDDAGILLTDLELGDIGVEAGCRNLRWEDVPRVEWWYWTN